MKNKIFCEKKVIYVFLTQRRQLFSRDSKCFYALLVNCIISILLNSIHVDELETFQISPDFVLDGTFAALQMRKQTAKLVNCLQIFRFPNQL